MVWSVWAPCSVSRTASSRWPFHTLLPCLQIRKHLGPQHPPLVPAWVIDQLLIPLPSHVPVPVGEGQMGWGLALWHGGILYPLLTRWRMPVLGSQDADRPVGIVHWKIAAQSGQQRCHHCHVGTGRGPRKGLRLRDGTQQQLVHRQGRGERVCGWAWKTEGNGRCLRKKWRGYCQHYNHDAL